MIVKDRLFLLEQSDSFFRSAQTLPDSHGACRIIISLGEFLRFSASGRETELHCRQFQIIPPDEACTITQPVPQRANFLYLSLEPGFWDICAFRGPHTLYAAAKLPAAESCLEDRELENILALASKITSEYQMESQSYYAFRYSWISEILMDIYKNISPACPGPEENSVIPEIIRFLENSFTQKISIDMLSAKFFVSKYHLMRQFKKETGCTIHHFILNKRINHACSLMLRQVPPSEACYLSGFTDYSLFFKSFTKITGFSPSQYPSGLHSQTG